MRQSTVTAGRGHLYRYGSSVAATLSGVELIAAERPRWSLPGVHEVARLIWFLSTRLFAFSPTAVVARISTTDMTGDFGHILRISTCPVGHFNTDGVSYSGVVEGHQLTHYIRHPVRHIADRLRLSSDRHKSQVIINVMMSVLVGTTTRYCSAPEAQRPLALGFTLYNAQKVTL